MQILLSKEGLSSIVGFEETTYCIIHEWIVGWVWLHCHSEAQSWWTQGFNYPPTQPYVTRPLEICRVHPMSSLYSQYSRIPNSHRVCVEIKPNGLHA